MEDVNQACAEQTHVVTSLVLYLINPELVPGPILFAALLVGFLTAHRYRRHLHISDMQYAIIGHVPGSVSGGLLLTVVSARAMSVLLGGAVLMAVAASVTSIRFRANRRSLFTARMLSGVMGTASSIGGQPMALLMQNEEQNRIRANLSAFFVASCIISLAVCSGQAVCLGGNTCYMVCTCCPECYWATGWPVKFPIR